MYIWEQKNRTNRRGMNVAHKNLNLSQSRTKHYEQRYETAFDATATFLVESLDRLSSYPLSASNPEPFSHRGVRPDLLVCWCADAQAAIEHACRDNALMQNACISLLKEAAGFGQADISAGLRQDTTQAVGCVLHMRGISPIAAYFQRIKRRRVTP
jgi:hypothetical protein